MRIGILTDEFSHACKRDIFPLFHIKQNLVERGHALISLNCDKVRREKGLLRYSGFHTDMPLDTYISWAPANDFANIHKTAGSRRVSYMNQNKILSALYPSPTPYESQVVVNNKLEMAAMFNAHALPAPRTLDGASPENRRLVVNESAELGRIFVLKPLLGFGGHNLYKLDTPSDLESVMSGFDEINMPFLIQDYIECHGVDYRAFVIDDKVVGGIKRQAKDGDWRGNAAQGAQSSAFVFTPQQQRDAVKSMQAAKLRFGAVDILIAPQNGRHFICEINDSAGTRSIESVQPGLDINAQIADMIEQAYG